MPIAESRSSYNGLLVFLFMMILGRLAASASTAWPLIGCGAAPAWDCGYPDASPATQYTAMSFAQPIRRVFGTVVFSARETGEMPPPGDTRPAYRLGDADAVYCVAGLASDCCRNPTQERAATCPSQTVDGSHSQRAGNRPSNERNEEPV